ncbi:hypothetical protein PCANC_09544 [Puccinia coronata f. sp. avenae]|jgi:hypothetical protein|uniref:Uncharacterized protein n=1 Tax=Puccinia coronata f. sp. avenae TaxID=200324 RepID=A0A2N5S0S1_9BASI|nr:hypothetical protein PCASD_24096 [Puccinia coronata f. sp. avenae]PLW07659.1 hypothetical protein PCASD_21718 [Puccinia coronata f. sp. avenae]PLW10006.1 hypothetical protein PCANC_19783 [Puccinia coronata f. sp. avenae]PLW34792.1 hypothetical protein PCASD_12653 [Puccinia coronata f. sp. avenae]PLW45054.1 hypothetical protein PCANC_09544 [Puccinia coronata f. sp. avenae]
MGTSKDNSDALLGFQQAILKELHEKDGLLLLAPGLGRRSTISSCLKAHCAKAVAVSTRPPLDATTDDEAGVNDELGMRMACIHHEI